MSARAVGINHVAFDVRDLDEALEWWGRWFAFELRGRRRTMAFIDLGDQFVALTEVPGAALREAGEDVSGSGSLRVRDPSGNLIEIVDYRDVQFSKTASVLGGMGLEGLEKSPSAIEELRSKGLSGD
jgi:lactoylglutathione lyase